MGSCEIAKCTFCGIATEVVRKYYHYNMDCECCSGDKHFEIVRYCKDCTPHPPYKITACVIAEEEKC